MSNVDSYCMSREQCFRQVGDGEGTEYLPVVFYDARPGVLLSHGYATEIQAHKDMYMCGADEKMLQEMWEEDVKPFLERVYGK